LSRKTVVEAPGAAQDIFWVIQTLPGISSDGDNSKIYVRGGGPDENLVVLDGATIKNPFHFDVMGGGYWSIFNARLVQDVEFYGGGFPARFGDRLSSVLKIENRSGSTEKFTGEASLSMSDANAIVEFPLPLRGSSLISLRRSYFDLLLKYTGMAEGEYTVYPYFFDMNAKMGFALSKRHRLTLSGLRSWEETEGTFDRPQARGTFTWDSKTQMASARLRSILSPTMISELVAYWSRSRRSSFHPGEGLAGQDQVAEAEIALKEDLSLVRAPHELRVGAWLVRGNDEVFIDMPKDIAYNYQDLRLLAKGRALKISAYADDKWALSAKWTVGAGVRADYIPKSKENVIAPRLNLAYAWNTHMSVLFDYGWFYQSPKAYELGANSSLRSKKAESYGLGLKHQVGDKVVISLEVYNKKLTRLVAIDSLGRFFNTGYGFARGAELYVHLKPSQGFFGWISYTYSVAKRKEGRHSAQHAFDFDRPHLVSLVANYAPAANWQVGLRFRYGSGRPYTPALGGWYDPQLSIWRPVIGEENSDRYPAYSRLDMRVTRRFQHKGHQFDAYLELMNAYNRRNVVHYMWNENYSSRETFTIFPFLPVLGLSAKF
jgi:outer membrane receptor protein involved in Fe transport